MSQPALDPTWRHEKIIATLFPGLDLADPCMAKLIIDAAKHNSDTGRYDVEKDVCIKRFRDRSHRGRFRPDHLRELAKSIDEFDLAEMKTFHKDVIEPLVLEFLKTRFKFTSKLFKNKGDDPTPERLNSFRYAFYHFQFACTMATRYQRNDKCTCQDISLTYDEDGEKKMLDDISGLCMSGEEKLNLLEVINWVDGHYGKLIDKAQRGPYGKFIMKKAREGLSGKLMKNAQESRSRNDNGELSDIFRAAYEMGLTWRS
ncbi:hypothetical protein V8C40DRAFT_269709 [Trichoderma camerunense]